jgi:hypothetical protein
MKKQLICITLAVFMLIAIVNVPAVRLDSPVGSVVAVKADDDGDDGEDGECRWPRRPRRVNEPSTVMLLGAGLGAAALYFMVRNRKRGV